MCLSMLHSTTIDYLCMGSLESDLIEGRGITRCDMYTDVRLHAVFMHNFKFILDNNDAEILQIVAL